MTDKTERISFTVFIHMSHVISILKIISQHLVIEHVVEWIKNYITNISRNKSLQNKNTLPERTKEQEIVLLEGI